MNPLVSICCITYNHEKYIAKALDSLLEQDTDFKIEIIVHDDASTDKTADIIRKYEREYPQIIRAICQKDNKYSKGDLITFKHVFPEVKGLYIAFCEGDDYWKDPCKLKKQTEFMNDNIKYSMCFHAVEEVNTAGVPTGRYLGPYKKGNRDYGMQDNIRGGFVHISSVLMRASLIKKGMPPWAMGSKHGDYALALFLSANGKTYYIDEVMSSHRVGVENSLMTKIRSNYSVESAIEYQRQRIKTLEEANRYYQNVFNNQISKVNLESKIKILLLENRYKEILGKEHKEFFKDKSIVDLIKLYLITKHPRCIEVLSQAKGQWIRFKK